MYELILSVINYKEFMCDDDFILIVNRFENLIKQVLNRISKKEREDVKQELLIKLFEVNVKIHLER